MMTTSVSDRPLLWIRRADWQSLLHELGKRGEGRRESGAFFLGKRRGRRPRVSHISYFDDLEPSSLKGAVHLTTVAYSRLWALCRELGVEVLADIHTHPAGCVQQSSIDQDNPLIGQKGHIALIVAQYAQRPFTLREVGMYEYRGDAGWVIRTGAISHRHWR